MSFSDSLLLLADAPFSFDLPEHNPKLPQYVLDKTVDSITESFERMHLSSERHLVPCSSCEMFLNMPHFQFLQCFPSGNQDFSDFICPQCLNKCELIQRLHELERLVDDLTKEKSRNEIADLEHSFDCLVDGIHQNNFGTQCDLNWCGEAHLKNPCSESDPLAMYINQVNAPSVLNMESDSQSHISSIVTITSEELSDAVLNNPLITDNTTKPYTQNGRNPPLIKHVITDTNAVRRDSDVTVLFTGDSSISNVCITNPRKENKCYKISKPGATVANTQNTLDFLLKSRFKNAKTVVLQVSRNDFTNSLSEQVKHDFEQLFASNTLADKHLVISGPVPSSQYSCEQFSRCLQLNDWLLDTCHAKGACFIDNFDLFWKKKKFFKLGSSELNDFGALVLSNNIRTSARCSELL